MIERDRPNQQFGSSTTLTNVKNIWKKVNMTVHGGFTKKKVQSTGNIKEQIIFARQSNCDTYTAYGLFHNYYACELSILFSLTGFLTRGSGVQALPSHTRRRLAHYPLQSRNFLPCYLMCQLLTGCCTAFLSPQHVLA